MDVVLLSRIQFALTIMFHYLFPPLTIGLGIFLVYLEGRYLKTRDPQYEAATKFWVRIFALNFAIGVASGIVMEFQFGTNWAVYSRYVGDVFGAALAAEGIFAFFLESGFLALLVFGWDKVSPKVHFFSTVMVALGSIFSAVWIIVAISWQQTPAGFAIRDVESPAGVVQRAELTDFWSVVFNPSAMDRLVHVLLGAFVLGAFFIMSVSAYYLIKNRHLEFARKSFVPALVVGILASIAVAVSGDSQGKIVAQYQPAKLAAIEGVYKTTDTGTPMLLFGIPDSEAKTMRYKVEIPGLLSFLVHGDSDKPVNGLDKFEPDVPPVAIPFFSFHIMVGLGIYFIVLTLYGLWCLKKGTLFRKKWLLWVFVFSVIGPFAANQLGWIAAEVGRQPWIVYNLLKTGDAVSKGLAASSVVGSIVMFGVIYLMLFAVWIYLLNEKIQKGPESVSTSE
ncbi:MAG: cytochrome ubiquinol oxidase subunit I [Acidobacteria bacterium]|nr:cytochrome ubiquinol oxidase subunit I [Acidobacteriota bacterium]